MQLVADRYRLAELVGCGGMGRVWRAHDLLLEREVALKEVTVPNGRAIALREARATARLSHPNVVRIYDVVDGERPWIIMEYLPARSLLETIKSNGPLPPGYVARIGLGVFEALSHSHARGVLHHDVTPQNILIGRDDTVTLTDFGLAACGPGEDGLELMGTPQYIAPERAQRGSASPASDLWSLGACLYTAVEGRSPYARPTAGETLSALLTTDPEPARHAGPLNPVLDGLLRRDPDRRMAAAEVRVQLRRIGVVR